MSDYEQLENVAEWLWELYHEYDSGELIIHEHIEMLKLSLQNPDYSEMSRKVIKDEIDDLTNMVIVDADWASMPADDKGATAEERIRSLRDYNISFFPVQPGYCFAKKISGVCYEVRSSFALEGKSLESILEDTIVGRAMDCHQEYAD